MLDKHLPQEKKKRPFLFGFTFLLLAGIPVLFMLTTYKRPPALTAERISIPAESRATNPPIMENSAPAAPTPSPHGDEASVIDPATLREPTDGRSATPLLTNRSDQQQPFFINPGTKK